jgi:hypothetical protein
MELSTTVRYAPRQFGSDVPPDLWEGKTLDISRSGSALELPHRLRAGGMVELTVIQTNPPRCVNVVGEVVRCKQIPGRRVPHADGSPGGSLYAVAVQFTRVLEIDELATLRESCPLDATEIERRDKT